MTRTTVGRTLVAVFLATLGWAGPASAQCSTRATQQFAVSVAPSPITFGTPTAANFNAGKPGSIDSAPVYLTFTPSRAAWSVCLRFAPGTATLGNGKATSDLLWSRDRVVWTPVTATDQVVLSGTARTQQAIPIYLRMLLTWTTDSPFTYGASLVFTGSY